MADSDQDDYVEDEDEEEEEVPMHEWDSWAAPSRKPKSNAWKYAVAVMILTWLVIFMYIS